MNNKIWLIGSGVMAQDYAKVLQELKYPFLVIGRSESAAEKFLKVTGVSAITGGLDQFLLKKPEIPSFAIVSVSRENLSEVTCKLLAYSVKNILVEKPAGLSLEEISKLQATTKNCGGNVLIGFNRRFYSSVLAAKDLIQQDHGVKSFSFDFTERSEQLKNLVDVKGAKAMSTWFLGNSIHVADLAFFLGGLPKKLTTYTHGQDILSWHPTSSIFSGAGISDNNALFSYRANWNAPGRWGVEIQTKNYNLIFRPLEELKIQKMGSMAIEDYPVDNKLDLKFKPGLYLQVKKFLEKDWQDFSSIHDLTKLFPTYIQIAGY